MPTGPADSGRRWWWACLASGGAGKSFLLSEVGERLRQLRDPRQAALLQQQDAATGQPAPPLELTVLVEFNAWRYEREPHLLIPLLKVAEHRRCARRWSGPSRPRLGPANSSTTMWFCLAT